jgi:leucyl/phenylalanyl-tRNA--protein transferase
MDTAFERVISACAHTPRSGQNGTWILAEMVQAYTAWHRLGEVHSIEAWFEGELVGGLYCVNVGRMVYGESMFSWRSDASKLALAALVAFCRKESMPWIDCQQQTGHLASLGGHAVPREAFEAHLQDYVNRPRPPAWCFEPADWRYLRPATDAQPR